MAGAYYNEHDPYAAQWLRNLIAAGHIAPGDVDERSIKEVQADDLRSYTQCHFFAGIGVWSHALRRAGWADDRPIWTGSCPCQPFSAAGKQQRFDDDRHLWPVWFNLIRECRPTVVVGEQVASALDWLDLVSADMEAAGYAFGASDLCAAGFSGAHIRQRLYFAGAADPDGQQRQQGLQSVQAGQAERAGRDGQPVGMGHANDPRSQEHGRSGDVHLRQSNGPDQGRQHLDAGVSGGLANADTRGRSQQVLLEGQFADKLQEGHLPDEGAVPDAGQPYAHAPLLGRDAADWLYCRDGKWRPVEPGTFPLAHEITARVGRLRAYGNALDAETAAQFCEAVMECMP